VLRRQKSQVLLELPPKIEDVRECGLSTEQETLYQQTLNSCSRELRNALYDQRAQVPYMHIFALIDRLKQICNHPSLALGMPQAYQNHESEKFETFAEIVREALESGQKIAVFSQYLGMVDIIGKHLTALNVASVTLTGASTHRERLVERFNNDSSCMVFIGSLKAGGIGIDLTAASVVIHYDRWWNAAKEDQATDRVHRIGQTRGVQVIKLLTKGTVEERIDAIIKRKRLLADESLDFAENEEKLFTREDLLALIDDLRTGANG
jgi:SNF2 family DNA or RNA helicase